MINLNSKPAFAARTSIKIDENAYKFLGGTELVKIAESLPVFEKKIKQLPEADTVHILIDEYSIAAYQNNKSDEVPNRVMCNFDVEPTGYKKVSTAISKLNDWLLKNLYPDEKAKELLRTTAENINSKNK